MSDACWQCGATLDEHHRLFCSSCHVIQPPGRQDHFSRLGFPIGYAIGTHAVEKAYIDHQQQLHPDRFVGKSDKERRFSLEQSMAVNEAYDVLKSPLLRAEYVLSLQDIHVSGDDANVKADTALLMESMEARELLAKADSTQCRQLEITAAEDRLKTIEAIKHWLDEAAYDKAAQETIRLRYLEKYIQEIREKDHAVANS